MTTAPLPRDVDGGSLRAPRTSQSSWPGLFDSVEETECPADRIEGTLPDALRGALYRNGPGNRRYSGSFFDGDGMIRRIAIEGDGRVHYRARFVRTEKFEKEQRAGRARVRTAGTNLPGGPLRNAFRPPGHEANTHVVMHHGRLLALEEGGHPYVIDPGDLSTLEMTDLGGLLPTHLPYSAHPHFDARTGETFNFGVDFVARKIGLRTFRTDPGGRSHHLLRAALPFASFVHDFALSERFMIFHVPPIRLTAWRVLLGLDSFFDAMHWDEDLAGRFILVPRDGGEIREFEAPAKLVVHYFGAHEHGGEIVVDAGQTQGWSAVVSDAQHFATSDWPSFAANGIHRYRIDPDRGLVGDEALSSVPAEFPRIHPLMETRDARWGYAACNPVPGEGGLFRGVLKVDRHAGGEEIFDFGEHKVSLEPVFVPHPDAGEAEEDRGWILCLVYDGRTRRSELAILDARGVADGPVATAYLPVNAGVTFHGCWVDA